ncbi:hypothetical protein [Roseimicrobium sp. ORNL1]|uniref:hypothetical protein n=1 Tax=Roseimicrobium sp. ORNL1 TaxID=2711231 RepID=UPI0013E0EDBD|nr:hypothetical protein [Roseimicrobium sp. ORNL1]QIF02450.1 hypothetical protein G5S37_13250 [Roseimicrobium sp. ORNL1]
MIASHLKLAMALPLAVVCLGGSVLMGQSPVPMPDAGAPAAEASSSAASTAPTTDGSAIAALPGVGVTHEKFQPDAHFEKLDFYWYRPAEKKAKKEEVPKEGEEKKLADIKKELGGVSEDEEEQGPRAVLVLADTEARTDVFADAAWMDFIKRQNWCVLVVHAQEKKWAPLPAAVMALDQRLFTWVDSKMAQTSDKADSAKVRAAPIPLIFHATGNGAFWMESLMMLRPGRFAAWSVAGITRFAEVPRIKDLRLPPGVILCTDIKQHLPHLDHFEDIRTNNKLNQVGFVSWKGSFSRGMIDGFARLTLEETMRAEPEKGLWLNVNTLLPHPHDSPTQPDVARMGWYANAEVLGAVKAFRPVEWPVCGPTMGRRWFKSREFPMCELRWIKNVPNPKGILVIANTTLPAAVRHMPEWRDYAKKREWAILLMALKEDRIRSEEAAAKFLEARLYKEIDGFAGPDLKNLPFIVYAQGTAGSWLQTLMLRQPSRYLTWVTSGTTRFPAITTAMKVPPGMLIAPTEAQYRPALLHFEDLRGADPYNPVCLLALPEKRPPVAMVEAYVRHFIDAALTTKKDFHRWVHLHDLAPPSRSMTVRPDPKQYAWFPSPEILGMWKELRQATEATPLPVIAKRAYKTKIPEVPELKLFVRIPGTLAKGQKPNGILCFCTWQQEDTSLVNRLKSTDDYLVKLADRQGLAMVTWNTADLLSPKVKIYNLTPENEADLEKKFTAFGEEWRNGIKKVCSEFKLEDSGMLLYGVSRGARFAHQISMRYPTQFLAVHTHIGNLYNVPITKEARNTLWLVTTGEVDGGYSQSLDFYQRGMKEKLPMLFKAGPSLGHASRRDIDTLSVAFFSYALDLRKICAEHKAKDRHSNDTPASLFAQHLSSAPYFGDSINHEIVAAAEAANWWVPELQRMALPTEPIAKAWGMPLEVALTKAPDLDAFAAGAAAGNPVTPDPAQAGQQPAQAKQ